MAHEIILAANSVSRAIAHEAKELTAEAGQRTDLESCIHQHARLLFKVAYGVLRNSHDAEDVVQETFLRAHRDGFHGVRDPQAWLATIAFRLAVDRKRKPEALDIAAMDLPASGPDAEHLAMRRQQVQHLRTLIASLPEDLRYPLVLSAVEELNSRQIGDILGIPESSVRGRLMRARQLLKDKMSERMESTL
jgi:RNA polymerase sigma-70 factor (ECF subfamily)